MNRQNSFFASVCALAVPVALQSMLQASFSIVDQIMIGQLGEGDWFGYHEGYYYHARGSWAASVWPVWVWPESSLPSIP